MEEQLKTARDVWQRYLKGETKAGIARELGMPRNEVQSIIKYTTQTLYFDEREWKRKEQKSVADIITKANKIIAKKKAEIETLKKRLGE